MGHCPAWYSNPMIVRLALLSLVAVGLALTPNPRAVLAHGPALKGQELDRSVTMRATTSSCVCDNRWFTFGLGPGVLKVTATVQRCGSRATPQCGIEAYLVRGGITLGDARPACLSSQAHCNKSQTISFRVPKRGVYYLLVRGSSSYLIYYSLGIHGPIYPLHCRKYC